MSKRKKHVPAFKAKMALSALSGEKIIAELSFEFGLHQTLIPEEAKREKKNCTNFMPKSAINLALMQEIDRAFTEWSFLGVRQMRRYLVTLGEALAKYGKSDIFNTDQVSQFTSFAFTGVLRDKGVRISMAGRGRWLDNVFCQS